MGKKKIIEQQPLLTEQEAGSARAQRGKLFWLLAGLVLLISFLYWALTRNVPRENPGAVTLGENPPDAVIEKFHLISTVGGKKRWELFSTTAKVYQDQKKAFADEIYAQYYKNDKIASTLTAEKAVINTETNSTQALGHVELIVENGSKLETDDLFWDPATDQIKTDGRVHIYKGMDEITATGLLADTQLNNIKFVSDVKTSLKDTNEIVDFEKSKKF